jgi:hypothetical protein
MQDASIVAINEIGKTERIAALVEGSALMSGYLLCSAFEVETCLTQIFIFSFVFSNKHIPAALVFQVQIDVAALGSLRGLAWLGPRRGSPPVRLA